MGGRTWKYWASSGPVFFFSHRFDAFFWLLSTIGINTPIVIGSQPSIRNEKFRVLKLYELYCETEEFIDSYNYVCYYSQTWVIRIARDRRKHSYNRFVQLRLLMYGIKGDFAGTGQKIRIIQDFVQLRFVFPRFDCIPSASLFIYFLFICF